MAERGYVLAKGDRRDFVVVDRYGEVYSLPRFADVKTKDVRSRIGDGADLPSIEQVVAQWVHPQEAAKEPEHTTQDALARITSHHAAFTRDMMERSIASMIEYEPERKMLVEEILQSDIIVKIGTKDWKDVYSTREMIALERSMADTAQSMTRLPSHKTDDHVVERTILNLNNQLRKEMGDKASLSAEQKHAIRHMAGNKQLTLVVGVAGAGKTTIMAGAKEALEAQGYRVRGAAPSGVAASSLQDIGIQASTLHSLEARIQLA